MHGGNRGFILFYRALYGYNIGSRVSHDLGVAFFAASGNKDYHVGVCIGVP